MALITCNECGKSLSDKATHCPHCGAEVNPQTVQPQEQSESPQKSNKKRNIVITALLLLLIAGGITAYFLTRPTVPDVTLKIYTKTWLKDYKFASDFEAANLQTDSVGMIEFTNLDPESFVKYAQAFNAMIKRNDLYYSWGAKTNLGQHFTDVQKQRLEAANYYVDTDYIIYNDRNIRNVFIQYPDETEVACNLYMCTNGEYQEFVKGCEGRHPYHLYTLKLNIETDTDSPTGFRLIDPDRPYGEDEIKSIYELIEDEPLPEFDQSIGFSADYENQYENEPQDIETEDDRFYEGNQVDKLPQFPGGEQAMYKWLSNHIKYPANAVENKIEGRVVIKFVVDRVGNHINAEIVRGSDSDLNAEALRVFYEMPNFIPAKKNGNDVACYYTLPINFKLR